MEQMKQKLYDYLLYNNTGTLYNVEMWIKEIQERVIFHLTEDDCRMVLNMVNQTI